MTLHTRAAIRSPLVMTDRRRIPHRETPRAPAVRAPVRGDRGPRSGLDRTSWLRRSMQQRRPIQNDSDRRASPNLRDQKTLTLLVNRPGPVVSGPEARGEELLRHGGGKSFGRVDGG